MAAAAVLTSCDDRSDSIITGSVVTDDDKGEVYKDEIIVTNRIKVKGHQYFEIFTVKMDSSEWVIVSHPHGVSLKEKTK